ncbi:hypothetical protein ACFSVK_21985 [Azorhizophilus paspali]|uniref:hypothetical protein n=1 Tax=Azorhizophilus paspali TaxID=69963 RepID=UPI00364597E6
MLVAAQPAVVQPVLIMGAEVQSDAFFQLILQIGRTFEGFGVLHVDSSMAEWLIGCLAS